MINNNNLIKSNKTLLIYALIYSVFTFYFVIEMNKDQSVSLGYVIFIFPIFWIIAGIVLGILFWLTKIKIRTVTDKIAMIFSTPIPLFIFFFIWSALQGSQSSAMTREFNQGEHRYRVIQYEYSDGQTKRIEYYKSQDKITNENPFPENDIWIKDSIWMYYKKDGRIEKTEDYRSK
jgi:glucan phosphoethanolaminetransferase (alkaline phosphatase superfamily)